jgi:2-polyprenyl-3-methyl-5-hydroxy-6-metoxy-1,4-benzoquinol methylase
MNRNCPICQCASKKVLYTQKFGSKAISLMDNYDVVACKDCGFVFADNIPSQKEFDNYYATMSKYEIDYTNQKHNKKIFDFISAYLLNENAHILDIGCSTGGLLKVFRDNDYNNLFGIDPSMACAEKAKGLNIDAIQSSLFHFVPKYKFDLIILSAVLEHIIDLKGAMEKLKTLLKPNGLLFVEVPNAARFHNHIHTPFQQFSIEHINYFSHWSLRNLMEKYNFEKLAMSNELNEVNQSVDPCIFWLAIHKEFSILRDTVSEENLKGYIEKSKSKDVEIKKTIEKKLKNHDKIIVWGVGTHTQMLLGNGILDLDKVFCFIDSNKNYDQKTIEGIKIVNPESLHHILTPLPILISSWSYQNEIAEQIRKMKLKNEVIKIYE